MSNLMIRPRLAKCSKNVIKFLQLVHNKIKILDTVSVKYRMNSEFVLAEDSFNETTHVHI